MIEPNAIAFVYRPVQAQTVARRHLFGCTHALYDVTIKGLQGITWRIGGNKKDDDGKNSHGNEENEAVTPYFSIQFRMFHRSLLLSYFIRVYLAFLSYLLFA